MTYDDRVVIRNILNDLFAQCDICNTETEKSALVNGVCHFCNLGYDTESSEARQTYIDTGEYPGRDDEF